MMMPREHLTELQGALCDQWPRCRRNHTAMMNAYHKAKHDAEHIYGIDPWELSPAPKDQILQFLLSDCDAWLNESTSSGIQELPPLHLHVQGSHGKETREQTLSLSPEFYVATIQDFEQEIVY